MRLALNRIPPTELRRPPPFPRSASSASSDRRVRAGRSAQRPPDRHRRLLPQAGSIGSLADGHPGGDKVLAQLATRLSPGRRGVPGSAGRSSPSSSPVVTKMVPSCAAEAIGAAEYRRRAELLSGRADRRREDQRRDRDDARRGHRAGTSSCIAPNSALHWAKGVRARIRAGSTAPTWSRSPSRSGSARGRRPRRTLPRRGEPGQGRRRTRRRHGAAIRSGSGWIPRRIPDPPRSPSSSRSSSTRLAGSLHRSRASSRSRRRCSASRAPFPRPSGRDRAPPPDRLPDARVARCRPALAERVLHHHERWDGAGYPSAVAGETIPRGEGPLRRRRLRRDDLRPDLPRTVLGLRRRSTS